MQTSKYWKDSKCGLKLPPGFQRNVHDLHDLHDLQIRIWLQILQVLKYSFFHSLFQIKLAMPWMHFIWLYKCLSQNSPRYSKQSLPQVPERRLQHKGF